MWSPTTLTGRHGYQSPKPDGTHRIRGLYVAWRPGNRRYQDQEVTPNRPPIWPSDHRRHGKCLPQATPSSYRRWRNRDGPYLPDHVDTGRDLFQSSKLIAAARISLASSVCQLSLSATYITPSMSDGRSTPSSTKATTLARPSFARKNPSSNITF